MQLHFLIFSSLTHLPRSSFSPASFSSYSPYYGRGMFYTWRLFLFMHLLSLFSSFLLFLFIELSLLVTITHSLLSYPRRPANWILAEVNWACRWRVGFDMFFYFTTSILFYCFLFFFNSPHRVSHISTSILFSHHNCSIPLLAQSTTWQINKNQQPQQKFYIYTRPRAINTLLQLFICWSKAWLWQTIRW